MMAPGLDGHRITAEGRNCWRRVHARRLAFLVDGEAYFAAFAAAAERAERSILILGWDIHSGIRLRRDGAPGNHRAALGDFLAALLARCPTLHVNVLAWDFAMIYALEREARPLLGRAWSHHPRLHFRLDGSHPLGGSHHQKIVVIDDAVAFVGGFDLAACRWDTPAHAPRDPRRIDPGYGNYAPFHDVQAMVDGEAARALGEMARERWHRATGAELPAAESGNDPWPPEIAADVADATVAIARTEPAWGVRPAVREIESLFVDAIASARQSIYLETQYLTSSRLCAALAERLDEPDGPEIVAVVPRVCSGWLEEATMGPLRGRVLRRLREVDRAGRLRIFHPAVPGLSPDTHVNVHSKLLIVDDALVRVGSANASSRSLRLDTECDLVVEADGSPHVRRAIAGFRDRLLAEHLGVAPARVSETMAATGSIGAAIEALRGGGRTLVPLEHTTPPWLEELVPETPLIDPAEPIPRHNVVLELLFGEVSGSARGVLVRAVAVVLGVLVLAAAWKWTPLAAWVKWAARSVHPVRTSPATALLVVAAFIMGSLLLFPATGLIIGTALIFGPRLGWAYALLGSLASAMIAYGLGRGLARGRVRRLLGRVIRAVSPRLAKRMVRAMATGRLVPVAPFTVVNLVAGAAGVEFQTFALRTVVTLTAAIAVMALLADRFAEAIRHPRPGRILAVLAVTLLVLILGPLARRRHWGAGTWADGNRRE